MVQAVLTGLDTWMSKKWREKQRRWRQQRADWRAEDIQFRFEEILLREEEQDFFQAQLRWREEDMKQRKVGNSRYLWNRFSERNRRDVEEKSEQLRSISWLSGLVTSFTMTSPIEFAFASESISIAKLTSYAIFAAIVPTLMITSTIICVYLLGRILKMGKMFVAEHVEDVFMKQCCLFAESNGTLQTPPKPRRTFERFWDIRYLFFSGIALYNGLHQVLFCKWSCSRFFSHHWCRVLHLVRSSIDMGYIPSENTAKPSFSSKCVNTGRNIPSNLSICTSYLNHTLAELIRDQALRILKLSLVSSV